MMAGLASNRVIAAVLSHGILLRSSKIMVVVGTILNLINQGDALFGATALDVPKALLTYSVPFCVSLYAAVAARLEADRMTRRAL